IRLRVHRAFGRALGWRSGGLGEAGVVALTQRAKCGDFFACDPVKGVFDLGGIVAADGHVVRALTKGGLERECGGGEISDQRIVSAAAVVGWKRRLPSARRGMEQLAENLFKRVVHEMDERLGVGEGRVNRSRAQTRLPLMLEESAVGLQ